MMFFKKYEKYNYTKLDKSKKSFTSDDFLELGESSKNSNNINILKIKNLSIKLWSILDDIEKILYKENMHVIAHNKPIFDSQKHVLILLDAQIENIYKYGLVSSIKKYDNKIKFNNIIFTTDTIFDDWNKCAKKINDELYILEQFIIKEDKILKVMKDVKTFESRKNKTHLENNNNNNKSKSKTKYIIIFLILILLICFFSYIFFISMYNK